MSAPTLLDIVKMNGSDAVVGLVDETTKSNVELTGKDLFHGRSIPNVGAARTIKGRQYKTLIRTALGNPTTGSFRSANEGSDPIKHVYENRLVETFILEPRFEVDKAVADSHEDGAAAYMAQEAAGTLEGEMQALCRCFYYGQDATLGNAKAFPGLLDAYDATNMVVDAGGTTADTGSSVWAVKFGERDVQWLWGQGGLFEVSDPRIADLLDASNKRFTGLVQTLLAYPGLQVGSKRSIGRIKKLTADSGKGLTDARLADLISKFAAGVRPDVIFASGRSIAQLQASRTATTETGREVPLPKDYEGIPIVRSDAILNTEALTL